MKTTGSSDRMELLRSPLASAGVEGMTTVRPGTWAYQASSRCEWVAARQPAIPEDPRKTIGTENWPPLMYRMFAALLTIWSIATRLKLKVMNSTIGRSPTIAAPMPIPQKPSSEIGVSMIRRGPNLASIPWLTL